MVKKSFVKLQQEIDSYTLKIITKCWNRKGNFSCHLVLIDPDSLLALSSPVPKAD